MHKWMLILLCSMVVFPAWAEYRIWTFTNDTVMEAEFVCMTGGNVVIRERSGKELKFLPDSLVEEDRRYVESRIPPELNIDVSKISDNLGTGGAVDWFRCQVSIRQIDTRPYSGELTVIMLVLGEDQRSGESVVSTRIQQTFNLKDFTDKPFELMSDRVKFQRSSSKSGQIYSGYLVVVNDPHGQVIAVKSNRLSIERSADDLLKQSSKMNAGGSKRPAGKIE